MKRMKKVLSIVLSLAMILTSITVYNTKTTKAEDDNEQAFSDFEVAVNEKQTITAKWSHKVGYKDYVYIYSKDEAETINESTDFKKQDSHDAISTNNDWNWNQSADGVNADADNIYRSKDSSIETQKGGEWVLVVLRRKKDDNSLVAFHKSDVIKTIESVITNKKFNLRSTGIDYTKPVANAGPTFIWDAVSGAEKYIIEYIDEETKKIIATYEYTNKQFTHYKYFSDIKGTKAGETYTVKVSAKDSEGSTIHYENGDTYEIKGVAKYYEAPAVEDPDKTEKNVEQTGYTNAEDIKDWKKLDGRTSDGSTAWISQAVYDSMAAYECNGLLPAGDPVGGKQKYNISSNLKAVDVFAFVAKDGRPTAVVINGTRYLNATANTLVYVGNDCIYINQSLLTIPEGQNTADYIITPEGSNGTPTFVLQLRKDERFTVSINGNETEKVETNKTYTLPTEENVEYYYNNGKIYKPGTEVEITEDIDFVTINNISVNFTNGAAIRIDDNQAGGIRFKADVDVTCGVESEKENIINAVQTGILLTTQDKLDKANNAELNIDNIETIGKVLNIENKGWFNDEVGSYCASLVNIVEANYPRTFVARAYIKVTSNDGVDYVYSQDNGDEYSKSVIRTIKGIANSIFKDKTEFNGYSDDEKSLIKKFAGIIDTAE
ncbi:hypothetical protein [Eubacterium ventriosum]|jgi:hypothetical protein|uniref:hypothetical protein n=1 Tax=Eubacterium ventriosum TaxID=39496 RepID=UPI002E76E950|nr:hypothetical protein [Eubacterium ventriosum]MEE0854003.1 hypothetical protein [Eubacterium ventriosum]